MRNQLKYLTISILFLTNTNLYRLFAFQLHTFLRPRMSRSLIYDVIAFRMSARYPKNVIIKNLPSLRLMEIKPSDTL